MNNNKQRISSWIKKLIGNESIRRSCFIQFILLLFFSILIIGYILLRGSNNVSDSILRELQEQMQIQVRQQIINNVNQAKRANKRNSDLFKAGLLKIDSDVERERYFISQLKNIDNATMIYFGMENGSFYGARKTKTGEYQAARNDIRTDGDSWYYKTAELGEGIEVVEVYNNFDPTKRPWYQKAKQTKSESISNIYSHFIYKEPVITVSLPVYDEEGELIGVFGVDYLLTWLGKSLNSLPINENGYVFITDEEGTIITSSADEVFYWSDNIKEQYYQSKKGGDLIEPALKVEENTFEAFKVNGESYFTTNEKVNIEGLSWNIHVILSENDYLSEMREAVGSTVVVVLLSMLACTSLVYITANRVTKPILEINEAAKKLTDGELIVLDEGNRNDELGELKKSFNKMAKRLTNLVVNLEGEVKNRTIALEERNKELERLSFLDGLTGIANRRSFDERIRNVWNTSLRNIRPLALIMLDIDWFKNYNDSYGHLAGDDCLKEIGKLLKEHTRRTSDLSARYGGEEFIIILEDMELDKVVFFAENIRKNIELLNIEHRTSPFKKITVSVGIAYTIPSREMVIDEFIKMADQAMYQAKERGRNSLVIIEEQG